MDWKFSSFILFVIAALVGIPWATSEAGICGLGVAKVATTGEAATNCFEFWLNRYQGTLSALIAGVIAAAGAVLLFRQTRATEIQVAAQRYEFLEKRIAEVRKIARISSELHKICSGDLHPSRNVRFPRMADAFFDPLISASEIRVANFAKSSKNAFELRESLIIAVESSSVSLDVSAEALKLALAALYFLDSCASEMRPPVVNLGLGEQGEPDGVRVRSVRSQHRFEQVVACSERLDRVAKVEIEALAARREAAKTIAL